MFMAVLWPLLTQLRKYCMFSSDEGFYERCAHIYCQPFSCMIFVVLDDVFSWTGFPYFISGWVNVKAMS